MITRLVLAACLAAFAFLMPVGAQAQSDAIAGKWDLRIDGVTIFRFEIAKAGLDEWRGSWSRPDNFATDGYVFARLRGGVETVQSMTGISFNGKVELSFDDPRPNAIPDIFRFELVDPSTVLMTYVGTDLNPFYMVRAAPDDRMGDWNQNAIYSRPRPDNGEESGNGSIAAPPVQETTRPQPEAGAIAPTTVAPLASRPPPPARSAAPAPSSYRLPGKPVVVAGSVAPPAAPVPAAEPAPQSQQPEQEEPNTPKRRVGADFLDGL